MTDGTIIDANNAFLWFTTHSCKEKGKRHFRHAGARRLRLASNLSKMRSSTAFSAVGLRNATAPDLIALISAAVAVIGMPAMAAQLKWPRFSAQFYLGECLFLARGRSARPALDVSAHWG